MKHLYNFQKLTLTCCVAFLTSFASISQVYDFVVNAEGHCVMEAENYSEKVQIGVIGSGTESLWDTASSPANYSGLGGMKAVNPGPARGDIAVALDSAAYLKYNINFTDAGTYYIWAHASKTGPSDDSFHAALAQGNTITSQAPFINFGLIVGYVNGTWDWVYASGSGNNIVPASVTVPTAGVYNFRVYIRERGFRIDKIILTLDPLFLPDSIGPAETKRVSGLDDQKGQNSSSLSIYPNPSADYATLSYKLESLQNVNITVYNALGKEVAVLMNKTQLPGAHELTLDYSKIPGSLNNSLYFIRFQSGAEVQTIKAFMSK
ncbi:MAG: T9SS type A sorting domain-containing protein [Bacteroidales bacterium]